MKKNWLTVWLVFIFLATAFLAQSAFGLMEKIEVSELTAQADLIVVGEVKKIESRWDKEGFFTYITIVVEQSLKGNANQEVSVRVIGGEVGDIGLKVSDEPEFKLGEKVKVFLKGKEIYDIVGLYQGKYTIVDGEVLKPTFNYSGLHWPGPNPMGEPYYINPNCVDPSAGTTDDQIAAIKDGAARAWMNEGNANFIFTYGGPTTKTLPDDGREGRSANGFNEIMFIQDPNYWHYVENPSAIATTFWWYYTDTQEVYECEMAFNDVNFTFNALGPPHPTSQEMDIWNVATHEFGHFLNLGHENTIPDATMYSGTSKGETKKRDLHSDDITGIRFIYGASANTNPVLISGSVSPGSGYLDTYFTFSVNYSDANGDTPVVANVYINDLPYAMSLYSGTPANGTYRYQTTLPRGTYSYYFDFQEANGGSDREPVLWTKSGPSVTNRLPSLSNGYVNPSAGLVGKLLDFYVDYTDADGDVPSVATVNIDGAPYTMHLESGSGANGTYHYQTGFPDFGSHNFYFYFEDGFGGNRRFPNSGTLSLRVYMCADAKGDDNVNVGDVIYLINYLFKGGPAPHCS